MKPISSKAIRLMFSLTMFPALLLSANSCSPPGQDDQFVDLANRYLEKARELSPEWSTYLGDHRYDHLLNDRSQAGVRRRLEFNRAYLDSLETIDPERLGQVNRIDYQILKNQLEFAIFTAEELKPHEWNPLNYVVGDALNNLIAREFAPLPERLRNLKQRLEGVPAVVAAAQANLGNPPRVHVETAIQQNRGTINLIMDGLTPFLDQEPDLKSRMAPARAAAIAALEGYGQWLENELLPRADGDFRLGDSLYRQKLRFTLDSELTREEIIAAAWEDLRHTQDVMFELALDLYPGLFPDDPLPGRPNKKDIIKQVLDALAEDHPDNDTIVDQARDNLAEATGFVSKHGLVTVPNEPVELIIMPEYQRGVAIAYCDSPGPLEENAKTFYSISPTPEHWSPEQSESFFREYNDYMLQNLTIHEAMPGHYLQLAFANRFEAPTLVRSIYSSGVYVEGWATYAEQLMAGAGYGGDRVKIQQLKMRLRLIINAILDPMIHCEGMTEQEAMDLMLDEGFQEEGEASLKWRRAMQSSCQLTTYYVGNMEVNRIRADYEAKLGDRFDLKTFNDALISYGSPAPKYVRELMGL
ncbi:MAG: DUF885 domain-containing protein [bacterium]